MTDRVKILVVERNGVEIDLREELALDSENVFFDNSVNNFSSDNTQEAIEEARNLAQGFPRAGKSGTYNGTLSDNDWLGPNELLPNTPFVVFPLKLQINEITWSNRSDDVEFDIEFRSGSKTGPIFYTLSVSGTNPGYGFVNSLAFTFNPGDTIWAQYKDNGQNMSDAEIILWLSRIP